MARDRRAYWRDLRLQGWSYDRIAKHAGVSRQRVQQLICPPASVRNQLAERAGYACEHCHIDLSRHGEVHHASSDDRRVPKADVAQLSYLCLPCHRMRHGYEPGTRPTETTLFGTRLSQDLRNRLAAHALDQRTSLNTIVETALREFLQRANHTGINDAQEP